MLNYLLNNTSTVIISLLLVVIVVMIIRYIIGNRGLCNCGKTNCSMKKIVKNIHKLKNK